MKQKPDSTKYYLQTLKETIQPSSRKNERRHQTEYPLKVDNSQISNKPFPETSQTLGLSRPALSKLSLRLPKVQHFLDSAPGSGQLTSPLTLKNNKSEPTTASTVAKGDREKNSLKDLSKSTMQKERRKQHTKSIQLEKAPKREIKPIGSSQRGRIVSEKLERVSQIAAASSTTLQIDRHQGYREMLAVQTEGSLFTMPNFELKLINLDCSFDEESDKRTISSATFTGASNTPTFAFTRPSNLKSIAAQFSRRAHDESPLVDELSESFYKTPKRVYVFQANLNSPKLKINF